MAEMGHMESLWWERGQPQRGVGRRSVYLEVRKWLRRQQWRGQKGRWGHIRPHGPHWCNRCYGSILSRGVACPNVLFQMLILAAVWRIDWRNWERNEESRRKLLESSQVKLGDHLDWGGGSEMAQRRQIWEVAGRSDGLGSGLGLVGEWKGGVKDDLRFLVYKIGWWYLLWWRTMDGSQFCGENIRSSVRYMTAPISWN